MKRILFPAAATVALLTAGCAAVRPAPAPAGEVSPSGVYVLLDHRGAARNILDVRMLEAGEPAASLLPGRDYWLRLHNASAGTISFQTFGMSLRRPIEWFSLPNGSRVPALANDAEVSIAYDVVDRRGRPVRYTAIDFFWISHLPPGRSVVFSVPRDLLAKRRTVCVPFATHGVSGKAKACYRLVQS